MPARLPMRFVRGSVDRQLVVARAVLDRQLVVARAVLDRQLIVARAVLDQQGQVRNHPPPAPSRWVAAPAWAGPSAAAE